jgi:NitT/TauT family transport system permease protein
MRRAAMAKFRQTVPAAAVIGVLIGVWWLVVVATHSAIFPTPGRW